MRISRLRLHDFRGWADLDLRPCTHVLLAGVPRAGRSDIIVALTRLLDPAFIRVQPTLADVRQQRTGAATGNGDEDNGATNAPDDDAPTAKNDIEVAADSGRRLHRRRVRRG